MRYSIDTKETDIIMCNSKNLGALIVDEEPHVREWDEPQYNINNLAIEESYGFGVLNEGQAIAVAKNVHVVSNDLNPQARKTECSSPRAVAGFSFTAANGDPRLAAPPYAGAAWPLSAAGAGKTARAGMAGAGLKGWLVSSWWCSFTAVWVDGR